MRNRKTYIVCGFILILFQLFVVNELGPYSATYGGYGFNVNAILLFLYFSIEFTMFSLMLAFYGEHFFRKEGIINLVRQGSRKKGYYDLIIKSFFRLLILKIICFASYSASIYVIYKSINYSELAFAFIFNFITCCILFEFQMFIEIKYGAKTGLLVINVIHIVLISAGSVLDEFAKNYGDIVAPICNFLNKLIIPNYLYLERVRALSSNYFFTLLVLASVLVSLVLIGRLAINKLDILEKEN